VVRRRRVGRPRAGGWEELEFGGDGQQSVGGRCGGAGRLRHYRGCVRRFIGDTGLADLISAELAGLDTEDVQRLAKLGGRIRAAVVEQPFPADLEADIRTAYDRLAGGDEKKSFAVRSV
jgi:hypothetical protein